MRREKSQERIEQAQTESALATAPRNMHFYDGVKIIDTVDIRNSGT